MKVEIVAPDNQRKISKYGIGPDWIFNTSSLMQVGPKKKNDHANNRNTAVGQLRQNPRLAPPNCLTHTLDWH